MGIKDPIGIKEMDGPEQFLTFAVRLSPGERREWGEAMLAELAYLQQSFTRWRFALDCARVALFPPRKNTLVNHMIQMHPRAAALIGVLLALPIFLLLSIAFFEIQPFWGFLRYSFTEADGVRMNTLSLVVLIGSLALLPVAILINLTPVLQSIRAGNGVRNNSLNLLLSIVFSLVILIMVCAFVIDQYPCWVGVPNCD